MGSDPVSALTALNASAEELLGTFSRLMHERYGARLYLFGSRARGNARIESDYDIVAVSDAFAAQPLLRRAMDRRDLWRRAGGWGTSLDLHCYTTSEFRAELRGHGYLSQAKARGELHLIRPARRQPAARGA